MLNLALVKSFVTLAETGSFQNAAKKLNLAQPTLSQHIRKLEETLGVQLFERGHAKSTPTREGVEALVMARSLLETAERMINAVRSDTLTIGASANIAEFYLAPLLSAFQREYDIEWQLKQAENPDLITQLTAGHVDVIFTEWKPDHDAIESQLWRHEPLVVVVPPTHKFAERKTIALADLSEETILGGAGGSGTGTLLKQTFGDATRHLPETVNVGSTQAVKSAVSSGLGVSIVLAGSVEDEVANGRLHTLNFEGAGPEKAFYLSYPKSISSLLQGDESARGCFVRFVTKRVS
ncbi:MAG: LysR family transcriptional regulator [Pseudomonadota bacterium]